MHVLIIGESDAGVSAGLRIQELDSSIEVSAILRDKYPNFSICGLRFLISGDGS
jgi:NADPH-dependent 2,4-dienoyl-CoA reductase/sulfur reductase-like enzyme